MDHTIEAAWIAAVSAAVGVGGTVTIGVVGFRSSRNSANQAIAAGAAATAATNAAREDRLWEKHAAAYEDTLRGLLYRQAKRRHELRTYRLPEDDEQQLGDFFAGDEPAGWSRRNDACWPMPLIRCGRRSRRRARLTLRSGDSTSSGPCWPSMRGWRLIQATRLQNPIPNVPQTLAPTTIRDRQAESATSGLTAPTRISPLILPDAPRIRGSPVRQLK